MATETAVLGSGCFWCTEAVFLDLKGVTEVMPGYAGGFVDHPTYEAVCTGSTGHAEAVKVTFDSDEITFKEILEVFFGTHDPTTLNRQGHDVGTQYRSAVFVMNDDQRRVAEAVIAELTSNQTFDKPIVTTIEPYTNFFEAEEYHRNYFARNPEAGYCQAVISPKLAKFRQRFKSKLKSAT